MLTPIPNRAAYLLELSTTATERETPDVPAEVRSLNRQALHLVESTVEGTTWKRNVTEYWLESDATQMVRDALKQRAAESAKPGQPASKSPLPTGVGTVADLRRKPFHELSDLAKVHMLEVRCAPLEIGIAMPIAIASALPNSEPFIEGPGREPRRCPFQIETIYAATVVPPMVESLEPGRSAKGRLQVQVGAGIFTIEHAATVVAEGDDLVVEATLGGPPTSMTRNSITLTLVSKGTISTRLTEDALPTRTQGTIDLELHGRRSVTDAPLKEAQLLKQTISFTLERIPVGWDQTRLITVGWTA